MSIYIKKIMMIVLFVYLIPVYAFEQSSMEAKQWLNTQASFSFQKIQENFSPDDGMPGSIIAAKSRATPNYHFHWVRDAALTMSALFEVYQHTSRIDQKIKIQRMAEDYIRFTSHIQNTAGKDALGEPKFYVNGEVFDKPWGRPQHDGPALRALSLIQWANILIKEGHENQVRQELYHPVFPADTPIKKDLEFISHHWKEPSYDLWEEVKGTHFYTLMVIRRALLEGAKLAEHFGDAGAAKWYRTQANEIQIEITNFWDESKGYFTATINFKDGLDNKYSNLDIAVLLGLLHGNMQDGFLGWDDPRVTATTNKLVKTFSQLYPINHSTKLPGVAIGRYPEDAYDGDQFRGGNPWPLCTLAVAEVFYNTAHLLKQRGETTLATEYKLQADQFVERVKYHAYPDGSLDEQMNRYTGYMTSARDLTWNYAAIITTRHAALPV